MELYITLLDFILIGAALWAVFAVQGLGGIVGRAFYFMLWGMILLGIAHISETITFEVLEWSIGVVELVHRLIVLGGFVLLAWGFKQVQGIKQ